MPRAKAMGAAHLHQPDEVRKDIRAIEAIHQKFVSEKKKDFAEGTENDLKQAQAWLAFAEGKYDAAIEALRPLADKEDTLGDEPQGIPTREMIADILLEAKHPQQALAEYQTDLKLNTNRFNGLYGAARAAEESGKQSEANEYKGSNRLHATLVKVCAGGSSTRPELSHARELLAKK